MKKIILLLVFACVIILNGCEEKKEVSGNKDVSPSKNDPSDKMPQLEKSRNDELNKSELNNQEQTNTDPALQEKENSNELGMTPGMPANFPSDVPQPKNSKVIGSLTSTEGTMVTFESNDKIQEIINYYKEELTKNGYSISEDGELITPDKGGMINWKKGTKEVQLVLGFNKEKNISSLVITYK